LSLAQPSAPESARGGGMAGIGVVRTKAAAAFAI
jgi:hypothetical protein